MKLFKSLDHVAFANVEPIQQPITWDNWKHEILCRLHLRFDPSRSGMTAPTPTKAAPTPTKSKLPNDVHYDKAFQNLVRQQYDFENNVFELSVYKVADKSTDKIVSDLTDLDRQLLQERDLNEMKAVRLKPLWAKGLSSQSVSEDLSRNERGYSWREIKKYWSLFNEVAKVDEEEA
jgi:hypothetical protein